MQLEYIIHLQINHIFCRVWVTQGNEVRVLSELIHYYQNDIFTLCPWKTLYKIHRNMGPCLLRDR